MLDSARRRLLRGGRDASELRPPWLIAPLSFTEDCTRCGNCVVLCPQHILRSGDGGFPTADFSLGECTLCGECTTQCEAGLFHGATEQGAAWDHVAMISERFAEREAVVSLPQKRRLTYLQLGDAVDDLARGLIGMGFTRGERIGIWSTNNIEWLTLQLATARIASSERFR